VFVLNRDTLQVEHDTGGNAALLDKPFPFAAAAVAEQLRSGQAVRGIAAFEGEGDRYQYVAQLIPVAARPLGAPPGRPPRQYIVVAQPEPNLGRILQDAQEMLLPAVLAGLVVALIAAYFLARSISGPVVRLSQAAAAVSRGDYNQQLPVRGQDEIATLTDQFNIMAQEVSNAHQMQRDFVANVSHDLKTPLTSIQGFSQAMLDGSITGEADYKQAAKIINTESRRMSRMVSQLLNLTQLQNGLRTLELRPVELGPLLGQLVLTMQPQTTAADIELVAQFSTDAVVVLGNADMLKQAFGNLIDNALKHTPSGGTITVSLLPAGNGVDVVVSDTGEGIPAPEVQRVMERFYQVDKARASGQERSLGLGLAITREIVQAHHGHIRIDSVEAKGTSVSVWLPASMGHSPGRDDTRAEPATTSVEVNGRAETYVPSLPASTSAGSKAN
jgi:signal transduction histidine kinase